MPENKLMIVARPEKNTKKGGRRLTFIAFLLSLDLRDFP
jgi:hypothetical protein